MCNKKNELSKVTRLVQLIISILIFLVSTTCFADEASDEIENIGFRYYYNQLDSVQAQIYEYVKELPKVTSEYKLKIDTDLGTYLDSEERVVSTNITIKESVEIAFTALSHDFPDVTTWFFWTYKGLSLKDNTITFQLMRNECYFEDDQEKADCIINEIVAGADLKWTRYEKAAFISDYVTGSMDYNSDVYLINSKPLSGYEQIHNNTYLGLVSGKATCEGYSRIYKKLADAIGLPCLIIDSLVHEYVYVQMDDDKWYAVEPQDSLKLLGRDNLLGKSFENGLDMYEPYMMLQYPEIESKDFEGEYSFLNYERISVEKIRSTLNSQGTPSYRYTVNDDGISITLTMYRGPQIGDLVIPEQIDGYTVTVIGESAFLNAKGFDGDLIIPDSVTKICDYAFKDCANIKNISSLPVHLTEIGTGAFMRCNKMEGQLDFPDTLVNIGDNAFRDCWNLMGSILIPDSVEYIGYYAFCGCYNLDGKIRIPAKISNYNSLIDEISAITELEVSPDNIYLCSYDGMLFTKDMSTLLFCPRNKSGEVVIPEGVIRLGDSAFSGCRRITKLIFPKTLQYFETRCCLRMSGLTTPISIPQEVKKVGYDAFVYTSVEENITLPSDVDLSEGAAFSLMQGCKRIKLCDGFTSLPNSTFHTTKIVEIEIPETVEYISPDCFGFCPNLTILGFRNSYAEEYASQNNINFSAIDQRLYLNYCEYTLDVEAKGRSNEIQLIAYDKNGSDISDNCRWISSDESVITVNDSGRVLAKAQGKATVTAIAENGLEAVCTFYSAVQVSSPYVGEGVWGEAVNVGDMYQISLVEADESGLTLFDGVKWTTSNPEIADFVYESSDCRSIFFVAKKVGECTITLTLPDGQYSETKIVVVSEPEEIIPPEKYVRLIYDLQGYDSCYCAPRFIPEGSGIPISDYNSDNPYIAYTLPNFRIQGAGLGKTRVYYTLSNRVRFDYIVSCEEAFWVNFPDEIIKCPDNGESSYQINCELNHICKADIELNDLLKETPTIKWYSYSPDIIEIDEDTGTMQIIGFGGVLIKVQATFKEKTLEKYFYIEVINPEKSIIVDTIKNGNIIVSNHALPGEKIQLQIIPNSGYELDSLTVKQGDNEIEITDNSFIMPNGDVIINARFVQKTFIITFNANGGDEGPKEQEKPGGDTIILSTIIPQRNNWYFLGWAENIDGIGSIYLPGENYSQDMDIVLYAIWGKPDFILPHSLTEIEDEAFSNSGISFVELPKNVTKIGKEAFSYCESLKYIIIPESVTEINDTAFFGVTEMIIIGNKGSAAEEFAKTNNYGFIELIDN